MKAHSIRYLTEKAKASFLRFPLTIISAFIAVLIGLYLTEYNNEINDFIPFVNVLLTASIGIPIFFCTSILTSKKGLNSIYKTLAYFVSTLILLGIYFSLPSSEVTNNTSVPYVRYAVFNIIAHLLVSFVPYLKKGNLNGFWNYNKLLFIRFLTSVLYSIFLYVGLILALAALDLLFDIEIHKELYLEINIVIVGLFNTWFFVSGIPENLDELEYITSYPKGLKIFTQYVLLPLLIIYLVILYLYGGKIIVEWDWPKGIISYMISAVSVLGILTLLLIYPYSKSKENTWIKKFTHAYYILLFPLIVLLFLAISIRINDYGVTINRYIIVLLGIWLSIVAAYFSLRKSNIKFIPISLVIILIPMSFGPWSMFSVSEKSQFGRLKNILSKHEIIENGRVQNEVIWETESLPTFYSEQEYTNENNLADSAHNEVKSIIDYLSSHHGYEKLNSLYSQNIDSLIKIAQDSNRYIDDAGIYMRTMGLKGIHKYTGNATNNINYTVVNNSLKEVKPFEYIIELEHFSYRPNDLMKVSKFTIDSTNYTLAINDKKIKLSSATDSIVFNLKILIKNLKEEYGNENNDKIPPSKMRLKKSTVHLNTKIEFDELGLILEGDSTYIRNILGILYLKVKTND